MLSAWYRSKGWSEMPQRRLNIFLVLVACGCLLSGCTRSALRQVLVDFRIVGPEAERGYKTRRERIQEGVRDFAPVEMRRLEGLPESTRVVFIPRGGDAATVGEYVKFTRRFESYSIESISPRKVPPDASRRQQGYDVVVCYRYREYRSMKYDSYREAAAAEASMPGRELKELRVKYFFDVEGRWDKQPGRPIREKTIFK